MNAKCEERKLRPDERTVSRRGFVRDLLVTGTGLAAVAAAGAGAATPGEPAAEATGANPQRGYQETEHVRDYYRSASY